MAIEFLAPDFVAENDPESIQQRMMNSLPADIDPMPGGFPYDFTMPTAIEKSELIQFHLTRTLQLMFPMWAWGEWLDYHAKAAGIQRRNAGYAHGILTIIGVEGTRIPAGSVFATPATDMSPSLEYVTKEADTIDDSQTVNVDVVAVEAGSLSNVPPNTIRLVLKPIKGILSIHNKNEMRGGTEEEDDSTLCQRIQEKNESDHASFIGNDSDYKRWSKEVVGVGDAVVVPEWKGVGTGTVRLVIIDANGQPANQQLIEDVYHHIMSPHDRMQRIAPIGVDLTVTAPDIISIRYKGTILLQSGYQIESVIKEFKRNMLEYYKTAKHENVIRYNRVVSILSRIEGVTDFQGFVINGTIENIKMQQYEYPDTELVDFTS